MRIVALSDTHNRHDAIQVPDGDVLVHAGDITGRGRLSELEAFAAWWKAQPHRHKVIIAGNHDFCFEREDERDVACEMLDGSHYLQDEMVVLEGLKFFGSPWQPWFFGWAFNLRRGPALADTWQAIPEDTDVLVTHGPPRGVLDETSTGENVGSLSDVHLCRNPTKTESCEGPCFTLGLTGSVPLVGGTISQLVTPLQIHFWTMQVREFLQ